MWFKAYRDYPTDSPLKKEQVTTSRALIGCEMHEINGWGDTFHQVRVDEHKKQKKFVRRRPLS